MGCDPEVQQFIEEFLRSHAVDAHGLRLLTRQDTLTLLAYFKDHNVTTYYLDALKLWDQWIQPDMAYDLDFSIQSFDEAIAALEFLDDTYHFEVI